MAGETVITVVGNMVDDPELRFTPSGVAVARFRVASTPRSYNKQSQAWEDGESLFLSCSVWRQVAENVAGSLTRGMRVIVQGRLRQRSYEDKQGVKRTVMELEVDEVGPSLRSAAAQVTKVGSGGGRQEYGQARQAVQQQADDPWSQPAGAGAGGWGAGSGGGFSDEPPF